METGVFEPTGHTEIASSFGNHRNIFIGIGTGENFVSRTSNIFIGGRNTAANVKRCNNCIFIGDNIVGEDGVDHQLIIGDMNISNRIGSPINVRKLQQELNDCKSFIYKGLLQKYLIDDLVKICVSY